MNEARENGRKGGRKSGEIRRNKKELRDCLEALLAKKFEDSDGQKLTGAEKLALAAFEGALRGDWKAWELVRDTAGQKPKEKESPQVVVNNLFDVLQDVDTSEINNIPEIEENDRP